MDQLNHISVKEQAVLGAGLDLSDVIRLKGMYRLEKFRVRKSGLIEPEPFDVIEFPNLVVNVGGALILDKFIGAAGTVFSNANAHIGIGNGTTAPAVGQTDLQGASKTRKAMEATFPSRAGQVMTFKSVFGTGDANYAWEEIALFNASTAGDMFSRSLVTNPFTKTAALSVTAQYTLTCP